ncbi:MAG: CIA30 family protein [Myxococcota bacterium]|nr:CIA30 family protein [Myxococcota bacterium]
MDPHNSQKWSTLVFGRPLAGVGHRALRSLYLSVHCFVLLGLASDPLHARRSEGLMTIGQLNWNTVNDTVMGGRSSATVTTNELGELIWSGSLSLENNGGFVSIRNSDNWHDWSAYDGVEVVIAGQGRAIQVTLQRADRIIRAGGYRALVHTKSAGDTRVFIPFSAFVLKRFGRQIDGPHLNTGLKRVGELGLLIADKRPGSFSVTLKQMKPVRRTQRTEVAVDVGPLLVSAIERGVPVFNGGDAKGCAEIYRKTLKRLVSALKLGRGTWAEQLAEAALAQSLAEPPEAAAWTLRRALDSLLYSLEVR